MTKERIMEPPDSCYSLRISDKSTKMMAELPIG